MTIGDVMAATAALILTGMAWAATILLFALAFPARTAAAQANLTASPKRCLAIGFGTVAAAALLAAVCVGAAAGPVKLVAGGIAATISLFAALGSAGAIRLLTERMTGLGTPAASFTGLVRASALYVLAGFLPGFGWFVMLPAALFLTVGSSVLTLFPTPAARAVRQLEVEALL